MGATECEEAAALASLHARHYHPRACCGHPDRLELGGGFNTYPISSDPYSEAPAAAITPGAE